jgi:hypothetical protein
MKCVLVSLRLRLEGIFLEELSLFCRYNIFNGINLIMISNNNSIVFLRG